MTTRRGFLLGLGASLAVVQARNIMRVTQPLWARSPSIILPDPAYDRIIGIAAGEPDANGIVDVILTSDARPYVAKMLAARLALIRPGMLLVRSRLYGEVAPSAAMVPALPFSD